MNRAELRDASEAIIRKTLRRHLPAGARVYLFSYLVSVDMAELARTMDSRLIDDRNRLTHVYDAATFDGIIARLPAHAALLRRVLRSLQAGQQPEDTASP